MKRFVLTIDKNGPCAYVYCKNIYFYKDEVINLLKRIADKLEEPDNDFKRFEFVLNENDLHYKGDSASK